MVSNMNDARPVSMAPMSAASRFSTQWKGRKLKLKAKLESS